jgi:hypothetical protein
MRRINAIDWDTACSIERAMALARPGSVVAIVSATPINADRHRKSSSIEQETFVVFLRNVS